MATGRCGRWLRRPMSGPPAHRGGGEFLGGALILAGALAIYWAGDIPNRTLGANQDPGPRAFPIGLGIFLILGGLYHLVGGLSRARNREAEPARASPLARTQAWLTAERHRDMLILVAALGLYIPAIPWLGFSLSTGLFAAGMMARLGTRWRWAVPVAIVLVAIIHLLFVNLFRVQLPPGRLGLPL
jgi:hypothetical protein